jgi:hypothetical protein
MALSQAINAIGVSPDKGVIALLYIERRDPKSNQEL